METKEQFTGLKRNAIDKFYTKESVVDFCLEVVKKCIDINKSDLILEPSAGNGAFISGIKKKDGVEKIKPTLGYKEP